MPRSNRRKLARVAIIFHTTFVPIDGNPYIKTLLESRNFRQTLEHQFSVETGTPGANLDWSSVVLDSRVTDSTRLEKWEQLAGPTQPLFAILKRLQPVDALPTTPVEVIEEVSITSLQPVEGLSTTEPIPPDPSVPMTSNMSSSSEVAKEPTMAEMMAQITALGTRMTNLQRDHSLELASMRRDHSLEIKGLTDKITTMERDHSLEIKGLTDKITAQNVKLTQQDVKIAAQNDEIDRLNVKLSESAEEAAKTDRRLSSNIEELQKTIDNQSCSIHYLMDLNGNVLRRKILEMYRNFLFDKVGRQDGDTTKDLLARVRAEIPTKLNIWAIDGYSHYSEEIHKPLPADQALLVLDLKDDHNNNKNFRKILKILFSDSDALDASGNFIK